MLGTGPALNEERIMTRSGVIRWLCCALVMLLSTSGDCPDHGNGSREDDPDSGNPVRGVAVDSGQGSQCCGELIVLLRQHGSQVQQHSVVLDPGDDRWT